MPLRGTALLYNRSDLFIIDHFYSEMRYIPYVY